MIPCTLILKMVVRHQKLERDTKREFLKHLTQLSLMEVKTSRCHLKTTAEFLKIFLLYFCLSSSYKDDPISSISCPIIIYSIVHYNLIRLQKGTALNCISSISTSQHGRTTALLSLYITVQLQEHPAPINISHKYSYKYIPPATLWDNIQDHPSLTQN